MDSELSTRLQQLEEKLDAIYISVEKTRKYFQWTLIITVVLFILPLIGLVFVVPLFLTNYVGQLQSLTQ